MATDLAEIDQDESFRKTLNTEYKDKDDILNFSLIIEPDEGMYRGGRFIFDFSASQNFPHEPPKVRCRQKIYHPNIDLEGNVCLNILREDWKPVVTLKFVLIGLQVSPPLSNHVFQNRASSTMERPFITLNRKGGWSTWTLESLVLIDETHLKI